MAGAKRTRLAGTRPECRDVKIRGEHMSHIGVLAPLRNLAFMLAHGKREEF